MDDRLFPVDAAKRCCRNNWDRHMAQIRPGSASALPTVARI
jgi:hypothetical protein